MTTLAILTLPWPPSMNHYWRHVGSKVLISAAGRAYRRTVADAVLVARSKREIAAPALLARLSVRIEASPPDRRVRDLDNMLKAPGDALTHAGVWADDGLIDELTIVRLPPVAGGSIRVIVSEACAREAA